MRAAPRHKGQQGSAVDSPDGTAVPATNGTSDRLRRKRRTAPAGEHGATEVHTPPEDGRGQPEPLPSPGQLLRQARLRQRLSLAQVAAATRIHAPFLEAIEDDDYALLPSPVYVGGFLRSYARYLGLPDGAELVAEYKRRYGPRAKRKAVRPVTFRRRLSTHRLARLGVVITGASLILGLLLVGWAVLSSRLPASRASLANQAATPPALLSLVASPVSQAVVPLRETTPRSQIEVMAQALEGVWLRVTVDGQLAYEGLLPAGEQGQWAGSQQVHVRAGNGAAVMLRVNGRPAEPLGAPDQVSERTFRPA